ncbi:MAG: hypothetical protein AAGG56_09815 [Pseudomonadota bacterium]
MRRAFGALGFATVAMVPGLAVGEIRSVQECEAAIISDPQLAREDAGQWARSGGGVQAKICEAAALEALGATATAARLLEGVAANPGRAMPRDLRAVLFEDAARLWLEKDQPEFALAALDRADQISDAEPERLRLRARAAAAYGNWPEATEALDALIEVRPESARAHALRAASLRHEGRLTMALWSAQTALRLSPDLPEGQFEAGAAAAELQDMQEAKSHWLKLVRLYPDHPLADAARRNLAQLALQGG